MHAIRIEATLEKDGELVLRNLPCKKNQKVEVIVLVEAQPDSIPASEARIDQKEKKLAIWQKLAGIGKDLGLPSDLAEQHDHYAHGTPKQ